MGDLGWIDLIQTTWHIKSSFGRGAGGHLGVERVRVRCSLGQQKWDCMSCHMTVTESSALPS